MTALKYIKSGLLFTAFFFHFLCVKSQTYNDPDTLSQLINKAVCFLARIQVKSDDIPQKFKGEWESEIINMKNLPLLGEKGYKCYDSNCFITSSIHNILSEIYLNDQSFDQIPPMLELSVENILSFKNESSFNFWHELNLPDNLKSRSSERNGIKRRRSNHLFYETEYASRMFNIFNDADDTAEAFRSLLYYNKICRLNGTPEKIVWQPDSIGWIFSSYRDTGRKHINYYNFFKSHGRNTGAFLTWFGRERYTTFLYPNKRGHNLPLGINDIDCVVNSNVLIALAEYNEKNAPGFDHAKNWILKMISENKCKSCGFYYPSGLTLYYSMAKAISKGVIVGEEIRRKIIDHLIFSQNSDGSWNDQMKGNELQGSLYALNALIDLCEVRDTLARTIIEKGLCYVNKRSNINKEISYWESGVFFSVGGLARKSHIWRSRAYTTALAIEALFGYKFKYLYKLSD